MNNPSELNETDTTEDSTGTTEVDHDSQEGEAESETQNESEETFLYDIDGEETSLETIREWKSGHLRQSDYTKKTQEVSELKKQSAEKARLADEKLSTLSALESKLEKLALGELADVDLEKVLEEQGSEEYLKTKHRLEQRRGKVADLTKELRTLRDQAIQEGHTKLTEILGWSDAEKRKADVAAISEYAKTIGISDQEFSQVTNYKLMQALLEAAKYRKLKQDNPAQKKKVTVAPKVTKPNAATPKKPLSLAERMYGKT